MTHTRRTEPRGREVLSWEDALVAEVQNTRFGVLLINVQDGEVTYIEKVIRRRIEVLRGSHRGSKGWKEKK